MFTGRCLCGGVRYTVSGDLAPIQICHCAQCRAAQGTPFEELILPNEVHGFLRYDSWVKADSAMIRFLDDKLKP